MRWNSFLNDLFFTGFLFISTLLTETTRASDQYSSKGPFEFSLPAQYSKFFNWQNSAIHFSPLTTSSTHGFLENPIQQREIQADKIYAGNSLEESTLGEVIKSISPGSIVILGERHEFTPHRDKQLEFLHALLQSSHAVVNVGMEFIAYPFQRSTDDFLGGRIDELTFLESIGWGRTDFDFYREQILFPRKSRGQTIALNAPRSLSGKIARKGLNSLSDKEASLLPPDFEIGSQKYLERFRQALGGDHFPKDKFLNYFTAQSLWDDTMAWVATDFLRAHPNEILVIVVGDFHATYGGGLKDRLLARGVADQSIVTISNADLTGLSSDEKFMEVAPHPRWGPRADFVWTSSTELR